MKFKLCIVIALALVIGMVPETLATTLTFEAAGGVQSALLPQTYGDYVAGSPDGLGHMYAEGNGWTPNVEMSYSKVYYYNDAEWPKVAYLRGVSGNILHDFTFTPNIDYGVQINSFLLNDYVGVSGGHVVDWNVYADSIGGTVLASGHEEVADGVDLPVSNVMSNPYYGTVVLRVKHTSGHYAGLALDNLDFDQVIPEPTMAAMLLAAGLMLVCWSRFRH